MDLIGFGIPIVRYPICAVCCYGGLRMLFGLPILTRLGLFRVCVWQLLMTMMRHDVVSRHIRVLGFVSKVQLPPSKHVGYRVSVQCCRASRDEEHEKRKRHDDEHEVCHPRRALPPTRQARAFLRRFHTAQIASSCRDLQKGVRTSQRWALSYPERMQHSFGWRMGGSSVARSTGFRILSGDTNHPRPTQSTVLLLKANSP